MKRTKQFLSVLLALMMVISIIPMSSIEVGATQSVAGNYNFDYNVLTGSGATDIVTIAQANLGRSMSSLGYTEAWCADFVSDCARLVGVENIIPFNGAVSALRNAMINAGGTIVSTRQKGDIVFYYCNYCGGWCHVGIVLDSTNSIEGNVNGQVYMVSDSEYYVDANGHNIWNGITRQYIRPNYPNGPIGKVEVVDGSANAIRIKGWAYDPDVPTESIDVHVYVGNEIYTFNANKYRKDVGDTIPGIGNYHGFDVTMPTLAAGIYSVRVLLVNNTWVSGNKSPFIYTGSVQVTHSHKYDTTIIKQATCQATGTKKLTCSCGYSYTVTIPVIEHTWVNASCTSPKICSVCGTISGSALGHNYTLVIKEATCQEEGTNIYICSICGDTYTEKIKALGHSGEKLSAVAPTCTETGLTDGVKCSVCDIILKEQIIVPATGHVYDNVVTLPTCTVQGYTTYTCSCGHSYVGDYVDATGHNDNNGDGYCDGCDDLLDPTKNCDCNCHKKGISNFFFKFALFFQKIFGTNKTCSCGIAHY